MRTRWKWIAVACTLLLGTVVAVAQGCGPDQANTVLCPANNGLYDPTCCNVNGSGCGLPCVDPTADLAICCNFFAQCEGDTTPDPGNCADWYQFWCAPDGGAASATTSSGGPTGCAGDCVPVPPDGWSAPQLLWIGPAESVPACPGNAPVTAYQGHAALVAPGTSCTGCACSIDGGSCSLPDHLTAGSGTCGDTGAVAVAFDPPPEWDGGCTDAGAVAAGALCEGAACVASLTARPLVLTPPTCAPSAATLVDAGLPSWNEAALACVGTLDPAGACPDHGKLCAPSAARAPGFLTCIYQQGEIASCPDTYPEPHVVYQAWADQRSCAPCTCGPPDSACAATLDVFDDDACTHKLPVLSLGLSSAGATCADLLDAGVALGSKRIDGGLAYDAGACAPGGGDAGGGFVPSDAATFCCLGSA